MLCKILIINMLDYKFKRFIFNIKLTVCFIATSCVAIPIKETTKVFAELKYTKKHLVIKCLAFCSLVDIQYYIYYNKL